MAYRVSPVAEWTQIFNDTWRWYRDFFYDANMHGNDWKKIGDKFRAMLPELNNRADLNWLLSQMVGELCVSHTYISGGDFSPASTPQTRSFTGFLGADITAGPERLSEACPASSGRRPTTATSPARLSRPDFDVKDGDFLIAIDGHDLKGDNPYRYLQVTRGQKVSDRRQPHALGGRGEDLRDRAAPHRDRPPLQPLDRRQHRRRPEGVERRPRLHAHHRDELQQHRPVRQVLARLPRPQGHHHRRARQRRRAGPSTSSSTSSSGR